MWCRGAGARQRHGVRAAGRVDDTDRVPVRVRRGRAEHDRRRARGPGGQGGPAGGGPGEVTATVTELRVAAALPVLDTVTVCGPLVVPTFWLPKLTATTWTARWPVARRRRQAVDLELGELTGRPAGVAGDGQPHVPPGGRREVDGHRVAGGRVELVAGRADHRGVRGAVGRAEHRQRLGTGRPSAGGSLSTTRPTDLAAPRSTVSDCGKALLRALPVRVGVAVDGVAGAVHLRVAGLAGRLAPGQVAGGVEPGARQSHRVRAAGRVAGHRQGTDAAAGRGRGERDRRGAGRAGGQRRTQVVRRAKSPPVVTPDSVAVAFPVLVTVTA